jgi:D-arabinose 1-dehydrogenase-like Zn-dependent alcohol dehydrogenase
MKAAVCEKPKGTWQVKEIESPQVGPSDVLIKIHASGLCYTDIHLTKGALGNRVHFSCAFGHEPVGEVIAMEKAAKRRKSGDCVGVAWIQDSCGRFEWCLRGKDFFCTPLIVTGIDHYSAHAEYMLAPAASTMLNSSNRSRYI